MARSVSGILLDVWRLWALTEQLPPSAKAKEAKLRAKARHFHHHQRWHLMCGGVCQDAFKRVRPVTMQLFLAIDPVGRSNAAHLLEGVLD